MSDADRRAVAEFLGGRALRSTPAGVVGRGLQVVAAVSRGRRGRRLEWVGQRHREHTIRQEWRPDRRGPAEADVEVGLRLRRRDVRTRAAGARRQPPVRRQRQRRRPCARPQDRMRLLVVSRGSHRAHGAARGALPPAGRRRRMGGVLRRSEGQRVRRGRDERPVGLDPQDRRASIRRHHRDARLPRRSCLRAGAGPQRGSAGRTAAVRMLHVPRQRRRARRQHRECRLEDLHRRRAAIARHECRGQTTVGPCRRRHLVGADHRRSARRACTSAPATDTPTPRSR